MDYIADRGVLYIAYGEKARRLAGISIRTLREHAPDLPVAVVADSPLDEADHLVEHEEADRGARTQKTSMYRLSPFKETLYLDADTEVVASPEAGYRMLQWVDLVLGQDVHRRLADATWHSLTKEERDATIKEIGTDDVLYYNSGVIFFRRNERVEAMMSAWHSEWQRWRKHDQMALLRAIYSNPVRIATIREPWNTHLKSKARFVYHKHRKAARKGAPV